MSALHRFIDIFFLFFYLIAMRNRAARDKLQITPLSGKTRCENRVHVLPRCSCQTCFMKAVICTTERARRFCRINVGNGKRRQKYFLKRFNEALLLCRAIVAQWFESSRFISWFIAYWSRVLNLFFFSIDPLCMYIFIHSLSAYFFNFFYFSTLHQDGIRCQLFFFVLSEHT